MAICMDGIVVHYSKHCALTVLLRPGVPNIQEVVLAGTTPVIMIQRVT